MRQTETESQWRRRLRVLINESRRQAQYDRSRHLDHYRARDIGRKPPDTGGDSTRWYTNVTLRYSGAVIVWVGYDMNANVFEGRVEGYPTVADIVIKVSNPSSSKSMTRAARYTLAFLEAHTGTQVFGTIKQPDGRYEVTVSPGVSSQGPSSG